MKSVTFIFKVFTIIYFSILPLSTFLILKAHQYQSSHRNIICNTVKPLKTATLWGMGPFNNYVTPKMAVFRPHTPMCNAP